ncbi:hypothetical protein GALMADRAFT_144857 [Galerina marginata CBS 339.88]|uniref:Uncharacterized protein n=1 Tax=Galerina marginata (strain CBS 339.88) TaxID=685588 RepID=A0A067SGY7_GALM3|nr:hypothetical protein GALMADRAFT_144857 [Galerina marginata CBS 339.88]
MGQFIEELPVYLIEWILKQQMFWVASAPLSLDGHVNISPKAIEGTFHVVNSRRVWYEDLSGTGAETVAHIRENGRLTILFHAFEGPARIVRLYGKGFFYELGSPEYEALVGTERRLPGSRAVIGLDILKVGTTCGYAVPYYQFISHRTQLLDWAVRKESVDRDDANIPFTAAIDSVDHHPQVNPSGMRHWWQSHNIVSLDGLPAFSRSFGLGFPFIFSLGRIRTPIASKAKRNNGTSALPKGNAFIVEGIIERPLLGNLWGYTSGAYQSQFEYRRPFLLLFSLLPFFLTFAVGVVFGRLYDRFHYSNNFATMLPSRWQ